MSHTLNDEEEEQMAESRSKVQRGAPPYLWSGAVAVHLALAAALSALAGRAQRDESGFQVAESLALAALGVVAVVALWVLMQALGVDIIDRIRDNILGSGT